MKKLSIVRSLFAGLVALSLTFCGTAPVKDKEIDPKDQETKEEDKKEEDKEEDKKDEETKISKGFALGSDEFSAHAGQKLFWKLNDAEGNKVTSGELTVSEDGKWWTDLIELSTDGKATYTFYYLADLDENGEMNPPPADHQWKAVIGPFTAESEDHIAFAHSTDFVDVTEELGKE